MMGSLKTRTIIMRGGPKDGTTEVIFDMRRPPTAYTYILELSDFDLREVPKLERLGSKRAVSYVRRKGNRKEYFYDPNHK